MSGGLDPAIPAARSASPDTSRAAATAKPASAAGAGAKTEFNSVKLRGAGANGERAVGFGARLAAFGHRLGDEFDDLLDRRPDEARLDAEEDIARFRRKRFDPQLDFAPWTGHGRFDVELDPAAGKLKITLRVTFEFLPGDPRLVEQGFRRSEFDWTPNEAASWKADALQSLTAIWDQTPLAISSTRPHWDAVRIRPEVRIVEDASRTHFKVVAKKYPRDAKLITSSVLRSGGTAELDSNDLRPEQKLDANNPVSEIVFEQGSPELDAVGLAALVPIAARLAGVAGAHVQLTGRASQDDVAGATPADDVVANMDLARARTAGVRNALVELGVKPKQILVRNAGQEGATREAKWRRVDVQVGTHELQLPILHEGGHMLASGDEYVDEHDGAAGRPLGDVVWAVAAKHYTGAQLTQGYGESLMSLGSTLQRQHLAGFVDAVRKITNREDWSV